jgi:CDP-4-dehydro-6-deoxyglucose reductase
MSLIKFTNGFVYEASSDFSILEGAIFHQYIIPYSCKTGRCGTCKCKLIDGDTKILVPELGLSEEEKLNGWILSCSRSAITDILLEVENYCDLDLPKPKTYPCKINSLEALSASVIKVVLRLPPNVNFSFFAGQYVDIIGLSGIRRSYSLARASNSFGTIELHISKINGGAFSEYWFKQAAVNDLLHLYGPQGTFFYRKNDQKYLIFLATGTGIAPVISMLEALANLSKDNQPAASIIVIWGVRYESDIYYDLERLKCEFKFIPVLSRAESTWQGERGYVQDALLRQIPDLSDCSVYACGSEGMIQGARATLLAAGLPSRHFHSDAFVCSSNPLP